MPLIQVTAQEGLLAQSDQDALMSRLSNAVLKSERASPSDPAAQALVWAYYRAMPERSVYVGGKNLADSPLHIAVTTPEGALDDARRKTLVEEIGSIVDDTVGVFDGRLNHWAMLYELDEGSWAGGGQIFLGADIQAAMNIPAA
jgi:phenylpyruvate tautomerase PptA (4-oxalocrotonate tautomerase family)